MNLSKRLELVNNRYKVISVCGGGGKTTTLYRLAEELKGEGHSVLMTTTTAMGLPEKDRFDYLIREEEVLQDLEILKNSMAKGQVTFLIKDMINVSKVKGVDQTTVDYIKEWEFFDFIIVETDGAKRKAIKAPREDEPLNPYSTDLVIGVIGLDALGKKIDEDHVHRVEIFKRLLDLDREKYIDEEIVVKLVKHPMGLFKNAVGKKKVLILNKADSTELRLRGQKIREALKGEPLEEILVMSLLRD